MNVLRRRTVVEETVGVGKGDDGGQDCDETGNGSTSEERGCGRCVELMRLFARTAARLRDCGGVSMSWPWMLCLLVVQSSRLHTWASCQGLDVLLFLSAPPLACSPEQPPSQRRSVLAGTSLVPL
jgi:hypothetical protein